MKYTTPFVLLLLALLCGLNGYSITYTHIQNLNDFDFVLQDDGATAIIPNANSSLLYSLPDDTIPALPCCYVNILLPIGESFSSLDYVVIDRENIPNVTKVVPSQREVPISSVNNIIDENLHRSPLSVGPNNSDSVVRVLGIHYSKPYYFVSVQICPFIYIADSCLSLIKELSINITTHEVSVPTSENRDFSSLLNIVVNPEVASIQRSMSVPTRIEDNVDYLIVTNNNLSKSFEALAQWKNVKGVRTKVISIEEINSTYNDASIQLKIKHCIKDYYQNNNLKFALLGGDDIVVPVIECYTIAGSNSESFIPTDKFYGCFDGAFNWDANANGIIGEVTDNVELLQHVHVSRLPVRTREDVLNYTQKLLTYEQKPSPEYVNKFLVCANMLWNNKPSGYSDAHEKSDLFYDNYIAPYWNGTKYRFYDTDTDFGGPTYQLEEDNINYQINNGYHFIHYSSHGTQTSLITENGEYSVSSVSELNNVETPVIFTTMACETNHFDNENSTCLSEALILHPRGGAIGYWGSSRSGWGYVDSRYTSLGTSFQYDGVFFKQLFEHHIYHFAELATFTKNNFIAQSTANGTFRWLQYSINAMGDAEMPIYTQTPISFENIRVIRRNDSIYVDTDGISATIAVTSGFGEQYFSVLNNVIYGVFADVPTEYCVVVTKHNYVPYIYQQPLYIQDQNIANSKTYQSKAILVGQQVSPVLRSGEVQIENNGNLSLKYEDKVVLDAGTNVKLGGMLQIEPLP